MWCEAAPLRDRHVDGDQMVVMLTDGRVLALSPLATAVMAWLEDGPLRLEEIALRLVERFGPPPEGAAEAIARSILREMSEEGLTRDLRQER